jgi:hypothetical protein
MPSNDEVMSHQRDVFFRRCHPLPERDIVDGHGGSEPVRRRLDKGMHVCAVSGDDAAIYGGAEKRMLRDFAINGSFDM